MLTSLELLLTRLGVGGVLVGVCWVAAPLGNNTFEPLDGAGVATYG